ncbi:hypothetical protein IGM_01988 [Bacillus cereus HuB4-4]|uniref:Uncharacterized protein n=1 Tax=Bacillus cereus HuB4-4 TaxID=1053211 RepID=A0A9W5VMF1_BACCE|nr:hypothetical protein IGM_01988 [Bacillus cereus HuB4-4]
MNFLKGFKYLFIVCIPMYIVILYFQLNKRKLDNREKSECLTDVPYGENSPLYKKDMY